MALRFTLRQLEYLMAVGEAGSIAQAAERVNVSSPSISAAIAGLEAEFGVSLFVRRHAQGLALTQAGRQFLDRARAVLDEAEALNRLADDLAGQVRGPLAIGCLLTFAQFVVPRLRREFAARHPAVAVSQAELNQQEILDRLRGGKIDVALTYDLDIPPDLRFTPLADLPPYVLVAQTHPLAARPHVAVGDLADLPMVLLDLPLSAEYFLSVFRAAGIRPRIAERTRDLGVMQSLVGNGFGFSIANVCPLTPRSPDGHPLRFIPLEGQVRPMVLGLLHAEGADQVLTVRTFIEHCRATLTPASLGALRVTCAIPRNETTP